MEARIIVLETKLQIVEQRQDEILEELKEIRSELTKYKGFIGGVLFIGSCVVGMLSMFKEHIFSWFK